MLSTRILIPKLTVFLIGTALLLAAAGCHSKSAATPDNFIAGLDAHFLEYPECLLPEAPAFPYETGDPVKIKQMNVLVASQLLTVESEAAIHVSRYTPTPAGARVAPRFCYGHRVVTGIDSFTPPATANGFPESQVSYHYKVEDVPVWADSDDVRVAFPAMAYSTSGNATDKATLAGTVAGWQVPD